MPLSQPGRDYDSENSERIGQPRWLLGLAGGAAHHRDGNLLEAQLVLEGFEDDLVGVESVLAQIQLVELGDPYGAVAVSTVRDLHAGEKRDHTREEHHPDVTGAPRLFVEAHKAGAQHEIGLPLDYGFHETVDLLRFVLAVGVEVDDDLGAFGLRYREARPEGVALAPVDDVADDGYALSPGDGRRRVGRAVVHDDRLYRVAKDLVGDPAQHPLDAALLVDRGHDDQDLTRVPLDSLFGREVFLGVLLYGEAGDDLAAAARDLAHAAQEVQKEPEEQQHGDREQRETAILEPEKFGKDPEDLRYDRDEDDAEGDEQREEQVEPAPPSPVPRDAVDREERGDYDARNTYVLDRHAVPRAPRAGPGPCARAVWPCPCASRRSASLPQGRSYRGTQARC